MADALNVLSMPTPEVTPIWCHRNLIIVILLFLLLFYLSVICYFRGEVNICIIRCRHAMHAKLNIVWQICPSVCPSISLFGIETNARIVKLVPQSGSDMSLVFKHYHQYKLRRESPSVGSLNALGWENCDFRPKSLSQKQYELGPLLLIGSRGGKIFLAYLC